MESAHAVAGYPGPMVQIAFTDAGADKFSKLTGDNIGRRLATILDGKILSAPQIASQIHRSGVISLGPDATWQTASDLADTLNKIVHDRIAATTQPAN